MIRVLHVVGAMNRGGVETWLMQVLRHIDGQRFQMDFCCLTGEPGVYAPEIEALGGAVLPCRLTKNLASFSKRFRALLRMGHYDVVHSHVHSFSGYVLSLAARAGIPRRIAHSHNTWDGKSHTPPRRLYRSVMRNLINKYATTGLGVSQDACAALFGPDWEADPRYRLLYCGIDLEPFAYLPQPEVMRHSLGIPADAFVVGHVGRFAPPKNHSFLLEIAAQVLALQSDAWFLLVGDGPLRLDVEQKARDLGIAHRVIFTGVRADVPALMAAMNVFLFPSLWEGLPVALIEAQAAGLPCLISADVTREVDIVPGAVKFLPRAVGASAWAEVIHRETAGIRLDHTKAFAAIRAKGFDVDSSVKALVSLYTEV